MKSFLSLLIASVAINTELFAAEAGMPQLDPKYWASQAFWLILVFTVLYFSISKFYLPKIKDNLDNRENKIKEDLENANKFKEESEAKLKEYDLILENAKKEVLKIHFESKSTLDKDIQSKKESMEKEIEREILKAQKEISELKKNSISSVQNISGSIVSSIIESISGDKLNESSIKATVEDTSKKNINSSLSVTKVAKEYEDAGVSGMSVLTDGKYFSGSLEDLILSRSIISLPLLRKDFVIDEYQIIEAKANGADVILLIAAILSRNEIKNFSSLANNLGLEILLEVHNLEEIEKSIMPTIDLFGVNNRNLKTFEVSLETSRSLAEKIPDQFLKVSESGISEPNSIKELIKFGYKGFLIGENFMKSDHPGNTARDFIKKIT